MRFLLFLIFTSSLFSDSFENFISEFRCDTSDYIFEYNAVTFSENRFLSTDYKFLSNYCKNFDISKIESGRVKIIEDKLISIQDNNIPHTFHHALYDTLLVLKSTGFKTTIKVRTSVHYLKKESGEIKIINQFDFPID